MDCSLPFTEPEQKFLLFFILKEAREYEWCESEKEVKTVIQGYRKKYGADFCLSDGIEINSCRELTIE